MCSGVSSMRVMHRYIGLMTSADGIGKNMPTIAVMSPKGGAGKSTLGNVLATTFYRSGASVAIMDNDPQKSQRKWKEGRKGELPVLTKCDIQVVADISNDDFFEVLKDLRSRNQIVILDTPGRAALVLSRVILRADLVLIPVRPSPEDIDQAIEAIKLIRDEMEGIGRTVPYACVMVETPGSDAFKSKIHKEFEQFAKDEGVQILQTQLRAREAYRTIFLERVAVHELDPTKVSGVEKAIANAEELAGEVFSMLAPRKEDAA